MKKYILCVIVLFATSYIVQAQNANKLFTDYANKDGVENVKVGKFAMSICKLVARVSISEANNIPIDKVSAVHVVSLEGCSDKVKKNFIKDYKTLEDGGGYETLIRVNGNNESTRIMTKVEEGKINEILILTYEDLEPSLIKISGKFAFEDIQKISDKKFN